MNQLTTIAALPGSGAGCVSALPAEKNEARPETIGFEELMADLAFDSFIDWSRIAIDLGPIGGTGC